MVAGVPPSLAAAYAHCERLARAHYENFPVASFLLPARMRPHVAALYAFARTADDYADEPGRPAAERLRLLGAWRDRLWAAARGQRDTGGDEHRPVFEALGHTMAACGLPAELFDDLLTAFEQDVCVSRYATWSEVLDYCRRSANPVGRLVLRIAGYDEARLDRSSDGLCTALQLTNFWQDLDRDWRNGRLYVPLNEAAECGATIDAFDPAALSANWLCALERMAARTRALFEQGRAVCDGVRGRLRLELRLTWLGGTTILDRVVASRFDVHRARPTLGLGDVPRLFWRTATWNVTSSGSRPRA